MEAIQPIILSSACLTCQANSMDRVRLASIILHQLSGPDKSQGATVQGEISMQGARQEITWLSEARKRAEQRLGQLWTIGRKAEGPTPLYCRPTQLQPRSGATRTHPCQIAACFAKKVRTNTMKIIRTSLKYRKETQARTAFWQEPWPLKSNNGSTRTRGTTR